MNARHSLLAVLAASLALACRSHSGAAAPGPTPASGGPATAAAATTPAEPEKPIDLGLRVEAVTKKGQGFIEPDEVLRSGDRMALHISVSEPAYVYVGYATSGKPGTLLFPKGAAEQIAPGTDFRFPPTGHWLELDKNVGYEDVFVYAARRELAPPETVALLKEDSARANSLRTKIAQKKKAPGKRRADKARDDSPEALTAGTRGLQMADEAPESASANGVSKAHFPIIHHK